MNLAYYIARRYLVAKKSHNAINIISMISVCSIVVATIALVCVLSVLNGFEGLVASMFNNFDPELKITPAKGKVFVPDGSSFRLIHDMPEIELYTEVLEENILVRYHDRQEVAVAKGVSNNYQQLVNIDSLLINGEFNLRDGDVYCSVLGIGLSTALGIRTGFVDPLEIYVPVRDRQVNMANLATSFQLEYAFITGEFMVNQAEYDERYMFLSLDMMRDLLNYENEVTALELKLKPQANLLMVKQQIRSLLGDDFRVLDRYEQQEASYKMLKIEKWMSFLILVFILLIALFNVVSSLSMLMIEKQEDVRMLRSMGADDRLIRRIFIYEGSMIPAFGALIGIFIGVILCLVQQQFGLIKLGDMGAFITNDYPVKINPLDLLVIFVTVCGIGLFVSWLPARYLGNKWLQQGRLAICLIPLLLSGCQGSHSGKPGIAVTIEPQRYFAEMIAGDLFDIYAVVPTGQSPETYDPAPHEMIRIAQSKAYLQIGRIGFELAWMNTIREHNPQVKFFDLSEGVQWIGEEDVQGFNVETGRAPSVQGSRFNEDEDNHEEEHADHGHHHHGGIDPHIWNATGMAQIIAQNTLNALLEIDPDNHVVYHMNYEQLIREINETAFLLHEMLDTLTCRSFIIYHPALTYFAAEYDLHQLSIESEGKEPSVSSLKELIDEAKKANVRVVFVQQEFDRKHATQVAAEIGARTVVINPLDRQWKEQMIHIAKELIR